MTIALIAAGGAAAQTDTEAERLREELRARNAAEEAAEAARIREAVGSGAAVTFEQVLERPGDIDLNLAFAKAEVARGNLRSAAATLERILLLAPDRTDVRLVYAIVLVRLESFEQARQELTTLAAMELPADVRDLVERHLAEIVQRRKKTRYYATATFGVEYNSNRNSGPDDDVIEIAGAPFSIKGTGAEADDDVSAVLLGSLGFVHDLGHPRGDALFGRLSYYHSEQNQLNAFDTQAVLGEFGRDVNTSYGKWTMRGFMSGTRLSHESYLGTYGGELRLDHKGSDDVRLYESIRIEKQNFQSIGEYLIADNEDGVFYEARFGMNVAIRPDLRADAYLGVAIKNARANFETYRGPRAGATLTYLMDRGVFVQADASIASDSYQVANPFVNGAVRRKDTVFRLRGTAGIPIETITGVTGLGPAPRWLRGTLVLVTVEHYNAASKLDTYDFQNSKVSAFLSKRWDF